MKKKLIIFIMTVGGISINSQSISGFLSFAQTPVSIPVNTNIIYALSTSFVDVSNAISWAGISNFGIVVVPSGTNFWTNSLVIAPSKPLQIWGSNQPGILLRNTNDSIGLYINANSGFVTISNFLFDSAAGFAGWSNGPYNSVIDIDGQGVCFRISHITLNHASSFSRYGIQIAGINNTTTTGPWGLIDNCNFYFPNGVVYNYINSMGNGNISHYGWTYAMTYGTTNTVVVENCNFANSAISPASAVFESMGGGRLCVRHCNITNVQESVHGENSGAGDSTLQVEYYNNNIIDNDSGNEPSYLFLDRGGSSIVFSNTVLYTPGGFVPIANFVTYWDECAQSGWQAEFCPRQLIYPGDYPSFQQIGQGVVGGSQGYFQCYCWSNSIPGGVSFPYLLGANQDGSFINQGRDVFTNSPLPGYTPLVYPHPLDK